MTEVYVLCEEIATNSWKVVGVVSDQYVASTGYKVFHLTGSLAELDNFMGATVTTTGSGDNEVPSSIAEFSISEEERIAELQLRLGQNFVRGMDESKFWWPSIGHASSTRTAAQRLARSETVLNTELPQWWRDAHSLLSAVIAGRILDTMTNEQVETCLEHLEELRRINIIKTWYEVGLDQTTSLYGSTLPGWSGVSGSYTIYTDTFSLSSGVLTPRTPDYAWLAITITDSSLTAITDIEPETWDPENPS